MCVSLRPQRGTESTCPQTWPDQHRLEPCFLASGPACQSALGFPKALMGAFLGNNNRKASMCPREMSPALQRVCPSRQEATGAQLPQRASREARPGSAGRSIPLGVCEARGCQQEQQDGVRSGVSQVCCAVGHSRGTRAPPESSAAGSSELRVPMRSSGQRWCWAGRGQPRPGPMARWPGRSPLRPQFPGTPWEPPRRQPTPWGLLLRPA